MTSAVFDNPFTLQRQLWRQGEMICWIAASALSDPNIAVTCVPKDMQLGPFDAGLVTGDIKHLSNDLLVEIVRKKQKVREKRRRTDATR